MMSKSNGKLIVVLAGTAFMMVTFIFWFGGGEDIEKPSFRIDVEAPGSATIMTDVSQGYKMGKPDPETWRKSEAWALYLTGLFTSKTIYYMGKKNQPLVNDDNYCEKREKYNQNRVLELYDEGLPTKESKNIYLQWYPWYNAMIKAAYKVGNVFNVKDQIKADELSPIRIPIETDIVWAPWTEFYFEHEIGKHYLCHGQRA